MVWQRKVVWSEGMFLRPQHFQQQDRYFNAVLQARSLPAQAFYWGFSELTLDTELLALGKLGVRSAQGVLPDGTPFCIPQDDEPPLSLEVGKQVKDQIVHLALPLRRRTTPEVTLQNNINNASARYQAHVQDVADCNDIGAQPTSMQLGCIRLSLRLAQDVSEGWVTLPLAQVIERQADGALRLDTSFIAPVVNNARHSMLANFCQDLHGLLRQKGAALQRMLQPGSGRGGISEVGDFLKLQFVNHWEAAVAHWVAVGTIHPERLFDQMVRMVGELSTFTPERRLLKALPLYDHDDLRSCFAPLMVQLRQSLIDTDQPKAMQIALQESEFGDKVAIITNKEWLSSCQFVLAVYADIPAEAMRKHVVEENHIKLGPSELIRDLVNGHLKALPLRQLPVAPRDVPFHANYSYFELDTQHELWQELHDSAGLSLHAFKRWLPGLELELWAIQRS